MYQNSGIIHCSYKTNEQNWPIAERQIFKEPTPNLKFFCKKNFGNCFIFHIVMKKTCGIGRRLLVFEYDF